MKLYTEEQVRQIYNEGCWNGFNEVRDKEDDVINSLTPIELPSDEEIVRKSKQEPDNSDIEPAARIGYVAGAKWMKEQIQKQIQKQLLTDIMEADQKDGLYDKNTES